MDDNYAARLPNYQLGDPIGKGAFGVVFKALNWTTGATVAVKQLSLANIPRSELPEIMSEIDLLKNLNHPNIVQYRGSIRTSEHLSIVLEFCENGSLHNIAKRFGKFPEALVSQYIYQVLEGLLYLHEQGVIHRDIKGSNILATKEGSVKLADFGVATRVGPLKDSSVVGSPYWMAPEVIDQSGATTSSDIWSVGAVVIELLEGRPPYAELDPMPALFRIVNDDCPPLPDGSSALARDFLQQCFQKDSNLRISARKLLRHPWMMQGRRQLEVNKQNQQLPRSVARRPLNAYDETVSRVQEWNKAIEAPAPPPTHSRLVHRPSDEVAHLLQADKLHQHNQPPPSSQALGSSRPANVPRRGTLAALAPNVMPLSSSAASGMPARQVLPLNDVDEHEDSDNWDCDFEEGIPTRKIAAFDKPEEEGVEDRTKTLKPPCKRQDSPSPPALLPPLEDYSDAVADDSDTFAVRVAQMKMSDQATRKILHPRDLSAGSSTSVRNLTDKTIRPPLRRASPTPPDSTTILRAEPSRKQSPRTPSTPPQDIARFAEKDDEEDDYSDLSLRPNRNGAQSQLPALQLTSRLSGRSWLGDGTEEDDPFAETEDSDMYIVEEDMEAEVARERLAKMASFISRIIEIMPDESVDDQEIAELCSYLLDHLEDDEDTAEARKLFTREHGTLALLEALQVRKDRNCITLLLRALNTLVSEDAVALEKICLIGGCPTVASFSSNRHSRDIRLEAALFIGSVCRTSLLTLQMFISSKGLRVLVDMADESYEDQKNLVWMAVDGILRVLEMQGPTPRHDFCRIFAHCGLLPALATALHHTIQDDDDLAESAKGKIVQIFFLFAQSDLKMREALAVRPVTTRLVRALRLLEDDLKVSVLRTIKNVSMSPAALDVLQSANVIETLVDLLKSNVLGRVRTELLNPIVNTLYNLCRLSPTRQEEAASAGAVPPLMALVHKNSPLKQFALPVLCDFAQASRACRKMLWHASGLDFFLGLLGDPFWSTAALDSISAWLTEETARVEDILAQSQSLHALVQAFSQSRSVAFESLLGPLLKILRTSATLVTLMTTQEAFLRAISERIVAHAKPVPRLNLLRLVKSMYEASPPSARRRLTAAPSLAKNIESLVQHDSALLVRELAKELSLVFTKSSGMPGPGNLKRSSTSGAIAGLTHGLRNFGMERVPRIRKSSGTSSSTRPPQKLDSDGLPVTRSSQAYIRPRSKKNSPEYQ